MIKKLCRKCVTKAIKKHNKKKLVAVLIHFDMMWKENICTCPASINQFLATGHYPLINQCIPDNCPYATEHIVSQ